LEKILARLPDEPRAVYLSPSELLGRLSEKSIFYVPVGSIEWHNEHLPLGTDTFHAQELSMALCAATGGVVLPPFWWNTDGCHRSQYTYYAPQDDFRQALRHVIRGFAEFPVKLLVLVNGHGGDNQMRSVADLADEINNAGDFPIRLASVDLCVLQAKNIDHADTGETSLSMRLIPQLVRMKRGITPDILWNEMPFANGEPTFERGEMMLKGFLEDAVNIVNGEYQRVND